mgnify:CR=1 FL=1
MDTCGSHCESGARIDHPTGLLLGSRTCAKQAVNIFPSLSDDAVHCVGYEALVVLKEQILQYGSRGKGERLDKLGRRLSEERLLSNITIKELLGLYDRYNDGESLDSIMISLRDPGMLFISI